MADDKDKSIKDNAKTILADGAILGGPQALLKIKQFFADALKNDLPAETADLQQIQAITEVNTRPLKEAIKNLPGSELARELEQASIVYQAAKGGIASGVEQANVYKDLAKGDLKSATAAASRRDADEANYIKEVHKVEAASAPLSVPAAGTNKGLGGKS